MPVQGGFAPMQGGCFPAASPQQPLAFGGPQPVAAATSPAPAAAAPLNIPASVLPDGAADMLGDLTLTSSAPPPAPGPAAAPAGAKQSPGALDIGNPFSMG
mmetsp:Transcript_66272/g.172372  ORF Transcript_66272/g.172372 Transcript_66272/m.172372 type:complete len:101 (+) Transcript_66272:674-976(+)